MAGSSTGGCGISGAEEAEVRFTVTVASAVMLADRFLCTAGRAVRPELAGITAERVMPRVKVAVTEDVA
jgi:hypothetical protein